MSFRLLVGFFILAWLLVPIRNFGQGGLINHAAGYPATDSLGRKLPTYEQVGPLKENKLVGMFYWTWHYPHAEKLYANNTTEFLKKHPEAINDFDHPAWPANIMNFWNEPLFGFYTNSDRWVLYRHAEMLADAGVDVIFFDCTNGDLVWKPAYLALCDVFSEARKNGIKTPQIAFMMAFGAFDYSKSAIRQVYTDLYQPGLYMDLWFYWNGKPLIMAYPDNLLQSTGNKREDSLFTEIASFFTFRPGQPVYNKGPQRPDHWGWLEIFPQHGFGRKANASYEQMTVGVSQNWSKERGLTAMNAPGAFGRSYTNKHGHDSNPNAHLYGYNFQEQWDHALQQKVDLIFVTGWNEWIAGRYKEWQQQHNAFPDQFDTEHSRDIEPMKGGHSDNYYYQLISNIRRFKGMPPPLIDCVYSTSRIDGDFHDWDSSGISFPTHKGNTLHRNSPGFLGLQYQNNSGRNDFVLAKAASDAENLYFYIETAEQISASTDSNWMQLLIDVDRNKKTGWEGYDFVVKRNSSGDKSQLEKFTSNGKWKIVAHVSVAIEKNRMELSIPKKWLKLKGKEIDIEFKWMDNLTVGKDIIDTYIFGDVAPLGRFNFQYCIK